jgi:hypothetical protein
MVKIKMTCPIWHFGQIGQGAKKPYGGFFLLKFMVKKTMISCSEYYTLICYLYYLPIGSSGKINGNEHLLVV